MRNFSPHTRDTAAALIADTLSKKLDSLKDAYAHSGGIPYFIVDELLPEPLANAIATSFPAASELKLKSTLRERKYISSQMNLHDALIEETLFAFHDARVVRLVSEITGHTQLHADPMLYAGGISRMERSCFLNPHIDNSHNKDRTLWRSFNLLYYISPGWQPHFGGNLEVWPHGIKDAPVMIESRFNRLVVMATHHHSLHSVSRVHADRPRNCISNYYFSERPTHPDQLFHVTSFRGRPEQPLRDLILRGDCVLRSLLRRIKSGGFFNTGHWYDKK
jgi:Rps23 Pro-64 3,4-dihydroxylase Tpa1-like proline 4-hydroxylase